jgi:pimeloyl-ACP methyl ester carboxylesterase
MPSFHNGAVEIAYVDEGAGEPIILVHGFASSASVNWVYPSWVSTLTQAGRRVIALDNRGHGASSKLYDTEDYYLSVMAGDVRALMDHLDIKRADIMGYSMGSRIAATLAVSDPERLRSVILAGIGMVLVREGGPGETVAKALEAASIDDVTDPMGRTFRAFAEQTRSDRSALAACIRGTRKRLTTKEEAASIKNPVLIAVGTNDDVAGSAHELAQIMTDAEVLDIPGRDHMRAVGDRVYKEGVLDFLARHS